MEKRFPAYKGDEPYIFVSYAHADDALVDPEIRSLHDQGFNVWYDEGLFPGTSWRSELAEKIDGASLFLFLITPNSVVSEHCEREVSYAVNHGKVLLSVHLELTDMPPGLDLTLGGIQAILRYELSDHEYRKKLIRTTSAYIQRGIAKPSELSARHDPTPRGRQMLVAAIVGLLLGAALTSVLFLRATKPSSESSTGASPIIRMSLEMENWDWKNLDPGGATVAITQDGQTMAFAVRGSDGSSSLAVRNLSRLETTQLAGTKGAERPFFSPDGRRVGYFDGNFIKSVSLDGGEPSIITTLDKQACCRTASWGPEDQIIFVDGRSGLKAVSVGDIDHQAVTELDLSRWEGSHRTPHHVTGHQVLLFSVFVAKPTPKHEIWALNLATGERRFLFDGLAPNYVASGHIVYAKAELLDRGSLWVAAFDAAKLTVTGPAQSIQSAVAGRDGSAFAAAYSGPLIFLPSQGKRIGELVIFEADGSSRVLDRGPRFEHPRFSNDGESIAVTVRVEGKRPSIQIYEISTGASRRLWEGEFPLWGPGDEAITFMEYGRGLVRERLDRSTPREILVKHDRNIIPTAWTDEGRTLVYTAVSPETVGALYTLELGKKPRHIFSQGASFASVNGDEQWIAFCTYPRGILVGRVPDFKSATNVSAHGCMPNWSKRDDRIYYQEYDKLFSLAVKTSKGVTFGTPELVTNLGLPGRSQFDVDELSRLAIARLSYNNPKPPVLITNWRRMLE